MFVAFGLILVIALFTALIGPYFIDWSNYKRDFEIQASRIIGQEVTVGGDAKVRLLPLPSLAFTDVTVGSNPDGTPMLVMDRFSANVELMPFLSGEVRIVDMTLERPQFNLAVDETGKIAWTDRKQLLVDPGQVKLDRLTVRDASFVVTGLAAGRAIEGREIDAVVSAQSLYGPWRIAGDGLVDGEETRFQISTGTLTDDNSLRLKFTGTQLDQPYNLVVDGPVGLRDGVLSWDGQFSIEPDFSERTGSVARSIAKPLPVTTTGGFQLSPTRLEIPDYRMEIGSAEDPFILTGKGSANLLGGVDFRLEVDGRQIDVDRIARMQAGENSAEPDISGQSLEKRIGLLRQIINQIPVPGFSGEIDLEIPAIIAGDTYIREVSALIKPFGTGWEIKRLSTAFPGNTIVEASGRLGQGRHSDLTVNFSLLRVNPLALRPGLSARLIPLSANWHLQAFLPNVSLSGKQASLDQLELASGLQQVARQHQTAGTSGGGW